jgi:hypothetical protein
MLEMVEITLERFVSHRMGGGLPLATFPARSTFWMWKPAAGC